MDFNFNKKEYQKKYYQENKEKFRERAIEYYKRHRQEKIEYMQKYKIKNKELLKQKAREYRVRNLELIKKKKRICYYKNRESNLNAIKEYNQKQRLEALSYYSRGIPHCNCCGERIIQFLTIDHKNGDGSKHRKDFKLEGNRIYRWLKQNNYPDGFQVLCFNCNCGKGKSLECPHKLFHIQIPKLGMDF